ncbi:MAG: hypothetical protein MUC62_01170 [Candidatus Thermoplasmatota archaeon]|jgi:hypothetical protein|nr:hypothetical protein [Candidatus Thermoplasmatota archaeon]
MTVRNPFLPFLILIGTISLITSTAQASFTVESIGTVGPSPGPGRSLKVSCLVISDDGSGPDLVEVRSGNASSTMYPSNGAFNWTEGVRYIGTLNLDEKGNRSIIISVTEGGKIVTFSHNITIDENGSGPGRSTIFGLPRWYCALSTVLLTIFLMFITFAYFKGRALQRTRMAQDGQSYEFCSSCGTRTRSHDLVCPSCKKDLLERIEVCGKCRSKVIDGSSLCPSCGIALAEPPS